MKCPICDAKMIQGDVVCKTGAGPTLYPKNTEDSELKHFAKMFFGSKDSIKAHELDEGWYCPNCKKVIVIWSQTGKDM